MLRFELAGHLVVQRRVSVPLQDFVVLDDVVLTPVDAQVTTLAANAPLMQLAQGSLVSDEDGSRQATLLVPAGTTATMVLPGGAREPLATLAVRATEFTAGERGPAAMPAELPPNVGYTYAVEYSVDQALAAGALRVEFSQPIISYTDNFIGFPVGGQVPIGYYDRERGMWAPWDDGRVIGILAVDGGLATLDVDGSGTAATEAALAALGITIAEREQLAQLYAPGQSLWRNLLPHFSAWDSNWGFGPSARCWPAPHNAVGARRLPSPPAAGRRAGPAAAPAERRRAAQCVYYRLPQSGARRVAAHRRYALCA